MPDISNPKKVAATRGYGANVVFSGSTAPEREAVAAKVIAETGARLVPPYDHPDIMLGQGMGKSHPTLYPFAQDSVKKAILPFFSQTIVRDRHHGFGIARPVRPDDGRQSRRNTKAKT